MRSADPTHEAGAHACPRTTVAALCRCRTVPTACSPTARSQKSTSQLPKCTAGRPAAPRGPPCRARGTAEAGEGRCGCAQPARHIRVPSTVLAAAVLAMPPGWAPCACAAPFSPCKGAHEGEVGQIGVVLHAGEGHVAQLGGAAGSQQHVAALDVLREHRGRWARGGKSSRVPGTTGRPSLLGAALRRNNANAALAPASPHQQA